MRIGSGVQKLGRVIPLFGLAIFLSAGLVFLVQPMTAKLLLPTFGGSPQVWTAATVFFQAALLVGYGYSHASIKVLGLRRQPIVHAALLLLPFLVLPITLRGIESADGLPPAIGVLYILLVSIALPYVAVSATSPLLQRWFSATGHRSAADPYFLYAAGNVGSLLGLLGYPVLVEPNLPIAGQTLLWSTAYVVFVGLCIGCAVVLARRATADHPEDAAEPTEQTEAASAGRRPTIDNRRRLGWIVRAFIPSSLMLGVTTYSSTDIAAVPLLWAIPLSIYLLTFVVAFSPRRLVAARTWERILPITTALVVLTIVQVVPSPIWLRLGIHYIGFFVAAMVAHGQLADDRPSASHLTEFYLLLAVGGVLGGAFNALVAPNVFDAIVEYPLLLVAVLLLRKPAAARVGLSIAAIRRQRRLDLLLPLGVFVLVFAALVVVNTASIDPAFASKVVVGLAVVVGLFFARRPVRFALTVGLLLSIAFLGGQGALYAERTFFGVNRVVDDGNGHRVYLSGSTVHGAERTDGIGHPIPLTYYHPTGPAGQVFGALPAAETASAVGGARETEVALVGLGAGALAAYGLPGQHYTFVEIDPAVIRIATDPSLFRFVSESRARIDVVEADGRLWLAAQPGGWFDLIVLDAFSSDAIPAHVVTREALATYMQKLRRGGRLLFNVSNSYLDVRSVVVGAARSLGLTGYVRSDTDLSVAPEGDKEISEWVVVARDAEALGDLRDDPRWTQISEVARTAVWTDDFSDVLGVLK